VSEILSIGELHNRHVEQSHVDVQIESGEQNCENTVARQGVILTQKNMADTRNCKQVIVYVKPTKAHVQPRTMRVTIGGFLVLAYFSIHPG
jgi:hypothetical protein